MATLPSLPGLSRFTAFDLESTEGEPFRFQIGEYMFQLVPSVNYALGRLLAQLGAPGMDMTPEMQLVFIKNALDFDEKAPAPDAENYIPIGQRPKFGEDGWVPATFDEFAALCDRKKGGITIPKLNAIFERLVIELTGAPFSEHRGGHGGVSPSGLTSKLNGA